MYAFSLSLSHVTALVVCLLVPTWIELTSRLVQFKVDLILNGKLSPEECCSYGMCKGDVVVAMA